MRAVMAAQTKTWLWTYSRVVSLLAGILLVISLLNCASHQRASEKRQAVAEHSFKGIVKQTLSGYKDNVYGVAFSPDGASVVGGSSDKFVEADRIEEANGLIDKLLKDYPKDEGGGVTSIKASALCKKLLTRIS